MLKITCTCSYVVLRPDRTFQFLLKAIFLNLKIFLIRLIVTTSNLQKLYIF